MDHQSIPAVEDGDTGLYPMLSWLIIMYSLDLSKTEGYQVLDLNPEPLLYLVVTLLTEPPEMPDRSLPDPLNKLMVYLVSGEL